MCHMCVGNTSAVVIESISVHHIHTCFVKKRLKKAILALVVIYAHSKASNWLSTAIASFEVSSLHLHLKSMNTDNSTTKY